MMRSLYSGVAGLKTHQTKMDVIGNNIANVNTAGFKASATNFQDTFYQTLSGASGASIELRVAGTNAKQIGLGSSVAAIQVNITEQGGTSTTNRALDVAIQGSSFLVVRSGGETLFTKSGALNVDQAGNLYCTTNGATVQGWLADDEGNVMKDTVKDLVVMSADKMYYEPTATGAVTMTGNIDPNDPRLAEDPTKSTEAGQVMTFSFYDSIGDQYSVKLRVTKNDTPAAAGKVTYDVRVVDVLNSNSESIFVLKTVKDDGTIEYTASSAEVKFGTGTIKATNDMVNKTTGELKLDSATTAQAVNFRSSTGDFSDVATRKNSANDGSINFSIVGPVPKHDGDDIKNGDYSGDASTFPQYNDTNDSGGVNVFFDSLTQYSQGGVSRLSSTKGDHDSAKTGNTAGSMTGIAVDEKGMVYGSYDNGLKRCLGQICVATFANPSGLESRGSSLFAQSLNSGEFDGIGEEVSLTGSFTVGALEMSNVDLANEFTQMITTQRGFQANSRIITTSDSMLEELVNLKR